ncbi:Signal transduction histidine kinase [Lachnospiraceae bacterium]|nr:Signal transduction histidine kinase [Lachnospiraceae bacterium]
MTISNYLKDKIVEIILAAVICVIIIWLLLVFKVNLVASALITGLFLVSWISIFIYDYNRKKKFYNGLQENVLQMDKAYLVLETLDRPEFLEGQLIVDALYEIDKSMAENVALYQNYNRDFSEYIEMWLHEVKLPLSAISLKLHNLILLDNTKNTDDIRKLLAETRRIELLVNQVLYYVRSGSMEKDYHISKFSVAELIHETAMTYRENLQDNEMSLLVETGDIDINEMFVNTDQKWFTFIMGQLISNSIKYKKDEGESFVKIIVESLDDRSIERENNIRITLEDNGIGIPEEDLKRVFEKSFTGFNGQRRTKSTGMGLYIVKELCRKLGHKVSVDSKQGEWTRVSIIISNDKFYEVV